MQDIISSSWVIILSSLTSCLSSDQFPINIPGEYFCSIFHPGKFHFSSEAFVAIDDGLLVAMTSPQPAYRIKIDDPIMR